MNKPRRKPFGFETLAIHFGQEPDPATGAVVTPIHLATTFKQESVGKYVYDYSRSGNPTRASFEKTLARLEGADFGFAFASGLAAEDNILRILNPGDHLIIGHDAYGGTYRLISKIHARYGIEFTSVNMQDPAAVEVAWKPNTKMVWIETPTNPTLSIADIDAISQIARPRGAITVVDNTFATPYLQMPINHGADIVVHSTTKYLGGHSDVVGGFVATNEVEYAEKIGFTQNAAGAVPSPFDCYLVQRGLKTLAVRMDRQCDNAETIVELLQSHPNVDTVYYPGLPTHPNHNVAQRQMERFGGMISFLVNGTEQDALRLVTQTQLFTLAESLGAVESLIEHPGRMTHASTANSPLEVDGRLVRISVGIESIADLVDDLKQALDGMKS